MKRHIPAVLVIVVLLVAGELAARLGWLPVFLPPPSALLQAAWAQPGLLVTNAGSTAMTALAGFAVAAAVAASAACCAVVLSAAWQPLYTGGLVLQSIPLIAAAPLLGVWLGGGATLQILIAALSSQFPILVGAMQGLRAATAGQHDLMQVLSASRLQTLRYVMLPMAAPYIFAGLKIAAPGAVLGAITGEWTGSERGLGTVMLYALFSYDIIKVWLSVLAVCALAAASYAIMAMVEKSVVFWDRPMAGLD